MQHKVNHLTWQNTVPASNIAFLTQPTIFGAGGKKPWVPKGMHDAAIPILVSSSAREGGDVIQDNARYFSKKMGVFSHLYGDDHLQQCSGPCGVVTLVNCHLCPGHGRTLLLLSVAIASLQPQTSQQRWQTGSRRTLESWNIVTAK